MLFRAGTYEMNQLLQHLVVFFDLCFAFGVSVCFGLVFVGNQHININVVLSGDTDIHVGVFGARLDAHLLCLAFSSLRSDLL